MIALPRRTTLALMLTIAVLASVIAFNWIFPPHLAAIELTADDTELSALPEFDGFNHESPGFDELGSMLERPLFYSDRTMPEIPKPVVAQVAPPTPLRLQLEGVAISAESRVAVLRDLEDNQLLQLAEGMLHDGWTLASVASTGARFVRGQEVSELLLKPTSAARSH